MPVETPIETAAPDGPMSLPQSGTPEYAEWRMSGELPEVKPQAESAPAETVDPGEATPPRKQERRKPDAEARIKALTDKVKELEAKQSQPGREQPKETAKEQPKAEQFTRPKPTLDDKADGKPKYTTYEDWLEDLADWKVEQRDAKREAQQREAAAIESVKSKVEAARKRYGSDELEAVLFPTNLTIRDADIPLAVKEMIGESDVFPDVLYVIGSDADNLKRFLALAKAKPGEALREVAAIERGIADELGNSKAETPRGDDGKFKADPKVETAPVKRGTESAPEPPIEIGNRGSVARDEADRAFSEMERGNPNAFADFRKAQNAKEMRRRRGA